MSVGGEFRSVDVRVYMVVGEGSPGCVFRGLGLRTRTGVGVGCKEEERQDTGTERQGK